MSCSVINTTKYKNLFFCRQSKTAYGQKNVVLIRGKGRFDKHRLDKEMDDYGISNIPDIYFMRQKEQKGHADAIKYAESLRGMRVL